MYFNTEVCHTYAVISVASNMLIILGYLVCNLCNGISSNNIIKNGNKTNV